MHVMGAYVRVSMIVSVGCVEDGDVMMRVYNGSQ